MHFQLVYSKYFREIVVARTTSYGGEHDIISRIESELYQELSCRPFQFAGLSRRGRGDTPLIVIVNQVMPVPTSEDKKFLAKYPMSQDEAFPPVTKEKTDKTTELLLLT